MLRARGGMGEGTMGGRGERRREGHWGQIGSNEFVHMQGFLGRMRDVFFWGGGSFVT